MTTLQLSIVCLTGIVLALVVRAPLHRSARRAPSRRGYRVTVHTKQPDDKTFYGVLVGDYRDRLVLEDAEYVTPAGSERIPGRQHEIAAGDVAWRDVHDRVAPENEPGKATT